MNRIIFVVFFYFFSISCTNSNSFSRQLKSLTNNEQKPALNFAALKQKAKKAFIYCKTNKLNTEFALLINMGMHSGLNRFFVWDFKKDTFINSFLVSHGCGNNSWSSDDSKENPTFSSVDGSHCTALGKYKIGERGFSNWGINVKYLMHGLEKQNANAVNRLIVFHGWDAIADEEIFPDGTPEGWGCPAISNTSMTWMDNKLKNEKKPVLMWIFNQK